MSHPAGLVELHVTYWNIQSIIVEAVLRSLEHLQTLAGVHQ